MNANIQPKVANMQQLIRATILCNMQPMVVYREKSGFAQRLMAAMAAAEFAKHKRVGALSKWCGVSRESARKWLAGESIANTKRIETIANKLNINGEWLITGRGSMRAAATDEVNDGSAPYTPGRRLSSIDAAILATIFDTIDRYWKPWPSDNRELADIVARLYAHTVQSLGDKTDQSLQDIFSQPILPDGKNDHEREWNQSDARRRTQWIASTPSARAPDQRSNSERRCQMQMEHYWDLRGSSVNIYIIPRGDASDVFGNIAPNTSNQDRRGK